MNQEVSVEKATTDEHAIQANYAQFRSLIAEAESAWEESEFDTAAALASAAARYAWFNHAGVFNDPALERLLVDLSGRVPGTGVDSPRSSRPHRRVVLHVATELYPTGGHTQMLARWISDDSRAQHRVVVTRQGWQPIPDKVARLIAGRVVALDGRYRSQLQRAAALRRICRDADIVVVHAHPDDIQPAVALATSTKPCIVVNHASHVFWAGTSIARTTVHLRRSAQELTVARRGLPADSGFVVNRPLVFPEVDVRREEARAHFGIGDDQVLVATAASGSKYEPLAEGGDLVQLLVGVIHTLPQLVVLAAGPRPEGRWHSAEQATGGRLRALGPLPNIGSLLAAADIYVDSFPFASITSLLEAGAHGIPLVSYRGHGAGCEVLGADPPAIDDDILYAETPDEFEEAVSALAADAGARESRGALLRDKIAATHSSAAWQDVVETLYEFAERPGGAEGPVDAQDIGPRSAALDSTVRCIQQRTGQSQGIDAVYRATLASLPLKARVRTWRRLRKSGLALGLSELLRDIDQVRARKAAYSVLRRTRPK